MRVTARFLFVGLCMTLIFSVLGAFSGNQADVPERGAAFHKPHHPLSAIELAPDSTTSFTDGSTAAPVPGFVLHVDLSAHAEAQQISRTIAPAPEAALNQRPPPRALFV